MRIFGRPTRTSPTSGLYVRAGSVESERAAEARTEAETVMLPALVRWIADILAEDVNSPVRREQQALDLTSR